MVDSLAVLDRGLISGTSKGPYYIDDDLIKALSSPTARIGALVSAILNNGAHANIFIPFDRKIAYRVKKTWDGWRVEEISISEIVNWKDHTKIMGRLKAKFVELLSRVEIN